jgi:hypothetical protein
MALEIELQPGQRLRGRSGRQRRARADAERAVAQSLMR